MTISQWLAAMARRWPVLLIGIVCTASAVLLVHKRPIAYQACGDVVVNQPISALYPNVYNNPRPAPITTTSLIVQQLMSDQVQKTLYQQGLTATYQAQVVNLGSGQAPIFTEPLASVCASSYNSAISLRTADAVVTQFGVLLQARQSAAHVAPGSVLTDAVLVRPSSVAVLGRPSQAYLGVAAIGLIITASCALWTDQWLRRRPSKGRRARSRLGWSPGPSALCTDARRGSRPSVLKGIARGGTDWGRQAWGMRGA